AFLERRPVWTADIVDDAQIRLRPDSRDRIVQHRQRAALSLPLMREEPFGTLSVFRETGHRFTQAEVEYLSTVASQLVVALDNARLFEAAEERAGRLRSLARLNQLVSSSLDTDEVLAGIAQAAATLMGVPVVSLWVADAETETLRVRAFSDEAMGAAYPLRSITFGQGTMGWIARASPSLSPSLTCSPTRGSSRSHGGWIMGCGASSGCPSSSRISSSVSSPCADGRPSTSAPTRKSSWRASWPRLRWPSATPVSTRRPRSAWSRRGRSSTWPRCSTRPWSRGAC